MMHRFTVSIIVPTRNRPEMLRECLDSIHSSYSHYAYDELIVVDGSDDHNAVLNKQLVTTFGAVYRRETRRGVAFARNVGVQIAKSEVLVFADDDFVVHVDWVENLVSNYADAQVVCCTGRILPLGSSGVHRLFHSMLGYDRGERRRIFSTRDVGLRRLLNTVAFIGYKRLADKAPAPWSVGCGFYSFRKEIFNEVGYFDEGLWDSRVHTLSVGEDTDMFYRILKANHKIVYEPAAMVYHENPSTIEGVVEKLYGYGIAKGRLFHKYRKDFYMLSLCAGFLFFSMFAWIRTALRMEREERRAVTADFTGFLTTMVPGASRRWAGRHHRSAVERKRGST